MGWFSREKKEKKTEKGKEKIESFTTCPVCGENIFVKVTTYLYDSEPETVGDAQIVKENEADCSKYTGEHTGYCRKCGGVVHGWLFAESVDVLNPWVIKHFNHAFLYAVTRMDKEVRSGKKANRLESLSCIVTELKEESSGLGQLADFAVGYYLLLMFVENNVIEFKNPEQFTRLRAVFKSSEAVMHDYVKELMKNNFPQFFI